MTREDLARAGIAFATAAGLWLAGFLFARLALPRIASALRRTPTDLDDLLLGALGPHVPFWFLGLGVIVGARIAVLPEVARGRIDRAVEFALILSASFAIASFLGRFVTVRAAALPEAFAATTLTRNVIRIGVVLLGALVALSNLGVSVTPVLTALGVGSLAVALALQPMLTNLFAGFQITLARQVRIGDYVELEGGQAGFVQDISWRSTLIRELADNLVVVPNARLAEIIVRNFTLPDAEMSVVVPCAVAYGSNLDHVERVVIEAAREVQRSVPGAVRGFEPLVRYHTFGESSIGLSIVIRVDDIAARSVAQSEVLKRLHTRFAAEGIEIPLPQRVVRTVRAAAD